MSSQSHLGQDLTLGLIQPKPAFHVNRNIMHSQSKHQRQTSCTKVIRFTYATLKRNFAHIQPCKKTLVTFPTPLQWEHSLYSHLEMAAHSPGTAAWSICAAFYTRLVTCCKTSTLTAFELVLLRQQPSLVCQRTRSNCLVDGKAKPNADTFALATQPKWQLRHLLPHR